MNSIKKHSIGEMHLKRIYFCHHRLHACSETRKKTTYKKIIEELISLALSSTLTYNFRDDKNIEPKYFAILPEYNTLQRNIQKIRQKANNPYPFPRRTSDLIIPDEFKITFRGESLMVSHILSESGEQTIIFASRRNLNYLSQSSSIYFDATFKTVPQIF
ncbi:LOW QUALITY PROTEIN: hypothetical protein HZS_5164 [Henneguya salminicola]|nr:LOW QUALITY PROTEIN: hypothetical protein HZS_5164 [Henneguya salminicola]